jgi:hypothetical protein
MSTRSRAVARALVAVVLGAMGTSAGCQVTSRSLGEDCLKDQDCLSGICSQLKCTAAPPVLEGGIPQGVPDTGAPPQDSAAPPPETGAPEAAVDTGTGNMPDSATDSAVDASQDATAE